MLAGASTGSFRSSQSKILSCAVAEASTERSRTSARSSEAPSCIAICKACRTVLDCAALGETAGALIASKTLFEIKWREHTQKLGETGNRGPR
jgi:hypothetical protein